MNKPKGAEASLLLYLETCLVDYGGKVESRLCHDDFDICKRWTASAYISFGRLFAQEAFDKGLFLAIIQPTFARQKAARDVFEEVARSVEMATER